MKNRILVCREGWVSGVMLILNDFQLHWSLSHMGVCVCVCWPTLLHLTDSLSATENSSLWHVKAMNAWQDRWKCFSFWLQVDINTLLKPLPSAIDAPSDWTWKQRTSQRGPWTFDATLRIAALNIYLDSIFLIKRLDRVVFLHFRQENIPPHNVCSKTFTRERVFQAASQGNEALLEGLLEYLQVNGKQLTSPDFTGKKHTCMFWPEPHKGEQDRGWLMNGFW